MLHLTPRDWCCERGATGDTSGVNDAPNRSATQAQRLPPGTSIAQDLTTNMATLFYTRSTCLRTVARHGRRIAAPIAPTVSFTTLSRPSKQQRLTYEPSRSTLSITARIPATRFSSSKVPVIRRHASTTAAPAEAPKELLTWDRFFDLRKKKRYINVGASITTMVITFVATTPLLTEYEVDAYLAQIAGLDQFIVLGMAAAAVAVGGYMCGPTFGNAGFKVWAGRRGWNEGIAEVRQSQRGLSDLSAETDFTAEREELLRTHQALPRRSFEE